VVHTLIHKRATHPTQQIFRGIILVNKLIASFIKDDAGKLRDKEFLALSLSDCLYVDFFKQFH